VLTMSVAEIKGKIKDHLGLLMDLEPEEIIDSDLFIEDLGADSIVIVQLYLSCQEEFGVLLADELNLAEPLSVAMLAERVNAKLLEVG
jgi:acyl carrier protein